MRLERSVLSTILACLASVFLALPASAAPTPAAPPSLDNATCLTCHDGKKGKLEVPGTDGKARALRSVAGDKFAQSVHANMQCVATHCMLACTLWANLSPATLRRARALPSVPGTSSLPFLPSWQVRQVALSSEGGAAGVGAALAGRARKTLARQARMVDRTERSSRM